LLLLSGQNKNAFCTPRTGRLRALLFSALSALRIAAENAKLDVVQANCRELCPALLAHFLGGWLNPSAFATGLASLLLAAVRAGFAIAPRRSNPIASAFLAGHRHTSV
jgi:hypothetical protein